MRPLTYLFVATLAIAQARPPIPRHIGPLRLGMPLAEFRQAFPQATFYPASACDVCAPGELAASVPPAALAAYMQDVLALGVDSATFFARRFVSCEFYRDRMVNMDLPPPAPVFDRAQAALVGLLGPWTEKRILPDGLGTLRWSDGPTVLAFDFGAEAGITSSASPTLELGRVAPFMTLGDSALTQARDAARRRHASPHQ